MTFLLCSRATFRKEGGILLLEALVAISILMLVAVISASRMADLIKNDRTIANQTLAVHLAQARMEELEAANYGNLPGEADSPGAQVSIASYSQLHPSSFIGSSSPQYLGFSMNTQVSPTTQNTSRYTLSVWVFYPTGAGVQNVVLTTIRSTP